MKRPLLYAAAAAALALAGCHQTPLAANETQVGTQDGSQTLGYTYDPKADLCYASGWGGTSEGGPILTNVPCTDRVKTLAGVVPAPPPAPHA